jgi:hypothetical protein
VRSERGRAIAQARLQLAIRCQRMQSCVSAVVVNNEVNMICKIAQFVGSQKHCESLRLVQHAMASRAGLNQGSMKCSMKHCRMLEQQQLQQSTYCRCCSSISSFRSSGLPPAVSASGSISASKSRGGTAAIGAATAHCKSSEKA